MCDTLYGVIRHQVLENGPWKSMTFHLDGRRSLISHGKIWWVISDIYKIPQDGNGMKNGQFIKHYCNREH